MSAQRRPLRPVHDRIPYSAFPDRAPITWPHHGCNVAVWVIPNIEHYEYLPPPSPYADPYPRTPHPDVRKYAYHDYGNRAGFWRLLQVLDRYAVPATVSLSTAVLAHYPEIAAAMVERQWEFMSHGLYNTRYLTGLDEAAERALLRRCNEVLEHHTGRRFAGMLGPNITGTTATPDLMAEEGMTYHADWVHDERPSPLRVRSGRRMVALPYSYELNDAPLLMRSHVEGDGYARRLVTQFDELCRDVTEDGSGRMMAIPLHPFTIGRPHRIGALERVLDHLRNHGAYIATGGAITDHYLRHHYDDDLSQAEAGTSND